MDSMVGKTESATRRDHIDPKLAATGWIVTPFHNFPREGIGLPETLHSQIE